MAQNQKVVVVLGKTGSGKSSLCNVIAGKKHDDIDFPTSSDAKSCTQEVNNRKVNFLGEEDKPITLVDTIGFDDPGKSDRTDVIAKVIKQEIDHVDTFVIAVNGTNARLEASLERMLKIFGEAFTEAFWTHVVVVFTQLTMDPNSTLRRRQKRRDQSDDEWARQYLSEVEKLAGVPLKYLFIDALRLDSGEELSHFIDSTGELYKFISASKGLKTDKEKQAHFLNVCMQEEYQKRDEEARREVNRLKEEMLEKEREKERLRKIAESAVDEAKQERKAKEEEQKKGRNIKGERDHFINKTQVAEQELADLQNKAAAERSAREEKEKEAERLRREAQDAKLQQTSAELERERAAKENLKLSWELEKQKKVQQIQQQRQDEEQKNRPVEEVRGERGRTPVSERNRNLKMSTEAQNQETGQPSTDDQNHKNDIKNSILASSTQGEFERSNPEIRLINAIKKVSQDGVQIFDCGGDPNRSDKEKTIVLAGAKGRGKSYFLKCLVNFIYCVNVEDDFRFRLPVDNHSKYFRAYKFHNNRLGFTLTVIDTPTFQPDTDTSIMEERITQGIQTFLKNGIDSVDAVCLIVNATDEQLTKTEKEVFKGLKKFFGRDPSVCVIANHCDSGEQPIKKEVEELMSSKTKFCKFLHLGAFFEERGSDQGAREDQRFYWRKGCQSFSEFFSHLSTLKNPIQRGDFEEAHRVRAEKKTKQEQHVPNNTESPELNGIEIKKNMKRSADQGEYEQEDPATFLISTRERRMQEGSSYLVHIFDCGLKVEGEATSGQRGEDSGKTVILSGAVGRGKTHFLNCLVNFLYFVELGDSFRFKLPGDKSKDEYRAYKFHNSRLGYPLTVINTPSFGVEQMNQECMETKAILGQEVVETFIKNGIDSFDAVCLIVNATDEHLSEGEKQNIKALPEYFGKDPSLCVIANHCDNGDPPIKGAIRELMSSRARLCEFLHLSAFFKQRGGDPDDEKFYWKKAFQSFGNFFKHLDSLRNIITKEDFQRAQERIIIQRTQSITTQSDIISGQFPPAVGENAPFIEEQSNNHNSARQLSGSHDPEVGEQDPLTGDSSHKSDKEAADIEPSRVFCCCFWPPKCGN